MPKKFNKEFEHVFYFCIWGRKYLDDFKNYTCNSLLRNLSKTNNKKNLIYIWTLKDDLKYLKKQKIIKDLSKIIKIKFYVFDLIKKRYYFKNNKYVFLSTLQSLFIATFSFNCKYIWFLYPDFIFSDKSINYIFKKLKKNKDLSSVMIPIPQVNLEAIELYNKKFGYNYIEENLTEIIIKHLHEIVKIYDIRNTELNTVSVSCIHEKNYLLMNNFHLHPVVIKTDEKNYNYFNSVFPSLDEGYTNTLKNKKIYIPKSSDEVAFMSLLPQNEYNFEKYDFNIEETAAWCEAHVNEFQRKNLNSTFMFYIKNSKMKDLEVNIKLIKKFKKRILDRLNSSDEQLFQKRYFSQLASRETKNHTTTIENDLLKMKSKYLNSIFKNQFYKTFKKSINYRINEVREKNRNQLSKIIFDLYMDIFEKKNIN